MKKTLLTLMGLLATLAVSAYTCVSFNSGDPSILMKKVTIAYEIDWDHARVTNHENLLFPDYLKKRGDDFVKDWPKDRKKAEKYFTVRFNKKSDYLRIDEQATSGEYKMTVRIATIDVGNGGAGFNPWASAKAGGVIINGTIEFADRSGQVVCVLNIVEAKGVGSPSETVRLGMTLNEIAGDIHNFIDDDVESGHVQATPVAITRAAAPAAAKTTTAAAKTTTTAAKSGAKSATGTAASAKAAKPAPKAQAKASAVKASVKADEDSEPRVAPTSEPLGNRKLQVTDRGRHPESYTVTINGQTVKMLLVRGGHMNMGYDGRGSRSMMSEPIHEVALTSFYISEKPLPASIVLNYVSDRNVDGSGSEPAQVRGFDDVETLIERIASETGKPFRLPTEAEWEYAASGEMQSKIFRIATGEYTAYEWVSDFHDSFPDDKFVQTDPTGPYGGSEHQIRSYNASKGKYDRSNNIDEDDAYLGLVRLAIKAKDIK